MDDTQENKLSRLLKVKSFLSQYAVELGGITQIGVLATALDNLIDDIFDADGAATSDTTGYAEAKAEVRTDLVNAMLHLVSAASAYYFSIEDNKSLRKADYSRSTLEGLRDSALFTRANELVKLLTPVAASLVPFNTSPTAVADLGTLAGEFLSEISEPKRQTEHKAVQGKMVDQYLTDSEDILEGLTVFIEVFRSTNLAMVLEFDAAKSIDDTGALYRTYEVALDANGAAIFAPFTYHPKKKVTLSVPTGGMVVEIGVPNAAETGFIAGGNTFAGAGTITNYHYYFTGSSFSKLRIFNQTAIAGLVKVKA